MTYFSLAQLLKSIILQRSLQNGEFGSACETFLPQMGQRTAAAIFLLSGRRAQWLCWIGVQNLEGADRRLLR